ncbi:MAG TPA: hypothetical protein VFI70_07035 [Nitrososphaeraceae archaeon]|nr:hypothetical protein [Nitrososphaeraceae archaeon]
MSDPAVIDWDRIIHKNVRSKDMQGAGNVVAIDGDSVIISTQGAQHQYKIPKSHVEGYNGAEVFLDIAVSDMSSFNTDNDNNIKAQTHSKEAGTLSNAESSVLPVKITKTSSQTPMIQGQEVQSKKEEGKEASEVSKQQYIKKEKVLANGIKQESAKAPIPSVATKTIATTTTNITSSKTHSYNNNKPEKTQQGAITTTAGLPGQRVNNDTMQKEQGLGKKEETISSIREGGPVKSEVTVRPTQSITTTANKTSTLPSKPTTQTQSKNNMPAPPPSSSSLTTKTLAEPPEKILSEEAEEAAVEKAVTRAETEASSSMTDDVKIQQQNRQEIENEVPTTTSTIQRQENIQPEVEVTIKPPNNIEFNPPISAENISTAMETGLSGSSAVDDISESKQQEESQRPQSLHEEEKIGQNNKDLLSNLIPFTTGFALWQLSEIYWIDMYNEFVIDSAKLTEYWFNAFVNPSTKREEKNDEK